MLRLLVLSIILKDTLKMRKIHLRKIAYLVLKQYGLETSLSRCEKLCDSLKDIKSPGKLLPILVQEISVSPE